MTSSSQNSSASLSRWAGVRRQTSHLVRDHAASAFFAFFFLLHHLPLLLLSLLSLLLLCLLEGAVQEDGQSCGVESFVGRELRSSPDGDGGLSPRSGQSGKLSISNPWLSPSVPVGLRPAPYTPSPASEYDTRSGGVVELFCESQLHRCAQEPLPRTQAALSAAPEARSTWLSMSTAGVLDTHKMLRLPLVCNRLDRDA